MLTVKILLRNRVRFGTLMFSKQMFPGFIIPLILALAANILRWHMYVGSSSVRVSQA